MKRTAAVVAAAALLMTFLAVPGAAAKQCKRYNPGRFEVGGYPAGEDADFVAVTDRATEAEPIELVVEVPPGTPTEDAHKYVNIQVDTKKASAGLFVRWEFPVYEDNDLYLYTPDGDTPADAAGFNPAPVGPLDGTGSGGHSEQGAEQIDGLRTKDCGGYTADLWAYTHRGGETVLKIWLGEPQR